MSKVIGTGSTCPRGRSPRSRDSSPRRAARGSSAPVDHARHGRGARTPRTRPRCTRCPRSATGAPRGLAHSTSDFGARGLTHANAGKSLIGMMCRSGWLSTLESVRVRTRPRCSRAPAGRASAPSCSWAVQTPTAAAVPPGRAHAPGACASRNPLLLNDLNTACIQNGHNDAIRGWGLVPASSADDPMERQ